jgi:hypothetical protein
MDLDRGDFVLALCWARPTPGAGCLVLLVLYLIIICVECRLFSSRVDIKSPIATPVLT